MRAFVTLLAILLPTGALADPNATTPVPQKHIPAPVLVELRILEGQFDQALSRDCAPEKCTSKGCIYQDHAVVDLPQNTSLPGLGQSEGLGSLPPQQYLTQVHCDFAHEKSVSQKDLQALVKRLEQRLSRGWLQVTVGHQLLEPISPSLAESPPPPQPKVEPAPKVEPPPPPAKPKWEPEVALRELWLTLLPHFAWMIAVIMLTISTLFIIWALRRLGRESIEEQALRNQLQNAGAAGAKPEEEQDKDKEQPPVAVTMPPPETPSEDATYVSEQQKSWSDRINNSDLATDENMVVELLRQWLKEGRYDLLAKALILFGDKLSVAFPADGELAVRKVEFAGYLKNLDEKRLPTDVEFFRKLNYQALSSSLLSQSDAATYQSLHEEFGSTGVAGLVEALGSRYRALLFALVPTDCQREVVRLISPALRLDLAGQLLKSNRIAREEQAYLFEVLNSARSGRPVPKPPDVHNNVITDRGRELDAPGALSVLLPSLEADVRQKLFADVLERSSGTLPQWHEDILYPDMLLKIPAELRADLFLEVDIKGLGGWSSVQDQVRQEKVINCLAPTMQKAVRAQMAFSSRADQLALAKLGRNELVSGVKRLVAQGKVSFPEIVA